jgi:ribosomal protein L11 methyltransferase
MPIFKWVSRPSSPHICLCYTESDEKCFTRNLERLSRILSDHEKKRNLPLDLEVHLRSLDKAEPIAGSASFAEPFCPIPALTIYPWRSGMPALLDKDVIALDPGNSFGTGRHPSTRLCLKLLQQVACQKNLYPWFSKGRVLDIGCGTGILSLAASQMGAREVVGVEIDRQAAKTAKHNVRLNGLASRISICHGAWDQVPPGKWHLIVANLTASVLFNIGGQLAVHLCKDGAAVVSGFLEPQIDRMQKFLRGQGLMVQACQHHNGWAAFLLHPSCKQPAKFRRPSV